MQHPGSDPDMTEPNDTYFARREYGIGAYGYRSHESCLELLDPHKERALDLAGTSTRRRTAMLLGHHALGSTKARHSTDDYCAMQAVDFPAMSL